MKEKIHNITGYLLSHPVTGSQVANLVIAGIAGSYLASRFTKRGLPFTLAVGAGIPLAILAINKLTADSVTVAPLVTDLSDGSSVNPPFTPVAVA